MGPRKIPSRRLSRLSVFFEFKLFKLRSKNSSKKKFSPPIHAPSEQKTTEIVSEEPNERKTRIDILPKSAAQSPYIKPGMRSRSTSTDRMKPQRNSNSENSPNQKAKL